MKPEGGFYEIASRQIKHDHRCDGIIVAAQSWIAGEPNEITTRADVLSLDGTDPHKIHIYKYISNIIPELLSTNISSRFEGIEILIIEKKK